MKKINGLLVGFVIMLLSSCGATNNSGHFSSVPPINNGIVIAEVLNNSKFIPKEVRGWSRILVSRIDDNSNEIYSLNATVRFDRRPKLKYAGALPPGKYRIVELYYFHQTDGYVAESEAYAPTSLGHFEVKANEVTNLGTIVYHPLFTPHFLDKGEIGSHSMSRIANPNLPEIISIDLNKWASFLRNSAQNEWLADDYQNIRQQTFSTMKTADFPSKVSTFRGQPALFGKLGGVYFKGDDGWKYVDLAIPSFISGGTQIGLGDNFLIHTSDNSVYLAENGFTKISLIRSFDSEKVEGIMSHEDQIFVLTFISDEKLNVYMLNPENKLQLFNSFTLKDLPGSVERQSLFIAGVGSRINIRVGKNLLSYDTTKEIWSTDSVADDLVVYTENDDVIFAAEPSAWSGITNTKYSTDGGTSWNQTKVRESSMFIDSTGALYYVAKGYKLNLLLGSSILDKVPVHKSSDKGLTWSVVGEVTKKCDRFLSNQSTDRQFWVLCDNGDLMLSEDKGKSWETAVPRTKLTHSDFPADTVLN